MSDLKKLKFSEHQLGAKEIEKYMRKRDIPDWFRGISRCQCDASSKLCDALLFDGEQRTTHRVRECLRSLGLKPAITKEQLKTLMKISRGSDLAFLWFLLESHYKSKGPGYTINEQILYSCIVHLDMVTTLRELDRLLPHNPQNQEIKESKKTKSKSNTKLSNSKPATKKDRLSYSPYLEILRIPHIEHRSIQLKRPDQKISLDEYEVYKDPTYIVQNESTRWFENYEPKSSKRIVGRILREVIELIMNDNKEMMIDINNKIIVCQYHRRIIDNEIQRKRDQKNKAREDIENYFDIDGIHKRNTRKLILNQIEHDVEMFMEKSRYDAERINPNYENKKIEILEGINSIRYYELPPNNNNELNECNEKDEDEEEDNSLGDQLKSNDNVNDHRISKDGRLFQKISFCDILRKSKDYDCFFRGLCEPAIKHKSSFNDQNFFTANQIHQPWYFDYQEIFNIEHSNLTIDQRIKLSFVNALNCDITHTPDINGKIDIQKAFDIGFKKQWSRSVEKYNRKVNLEPQIKENCIKKEENDEIPLRFDRDYFDPDDKEYMLYMLKRCFDLMKKNPKFVLAGLPNAHKIPSLLYFIQDRFGKRYSFEECQSVFAESMRILRALGKLTKAAPAPKIDGFSTAPKVSYACRNYVISKGEKARQKYYNELDQIIMNEARIFWFSMRPYLFRSGPPRNTYFAYMPPRTVDLTRFRQWKPSEYMDAKKAWDRRQKLGKGW